MSASRSSVFVGGCRRDGSHAPAAAAEKSRALLAALTACNGRVRIHGCGRAGREVRELRAYGRRRAACWRFPCTLATARTWRTTAERARASIFVVRASATAACARRALAMSALLAALAKTQFATQNPTATAARYVKASLVGRPDTASAVGWCTRRASGITPRSGRASQSRNGEGAVAGRWCSNSRGRSAAAMDAELAVPKPVEPTFRLKPHDHKKCVHRRVTAAGNSIAASPAPNARRQPRRSCRFSPSAVKKACEEVVNAVLEGKAWHGEEETVWTVQIAEQIKARVKGEWPPLPPVIG